MSGGPEGGVATEKITVLPDAQGRAASLSRWSPCVGTEATELMRRLCAAGKLDEEAAERIVDQSATVLSCCVPPTELGTTVGLVIGYVQSGKTMSFTTVAALARDNGFRIVVLLTGTSKPLLEQSTSRLRDDLRISNLSAPNRAWLTLVNPSPRNRAGATISQALEAWDDPDVPAEGRQTLLLPVMKHVTHLRNLREALSSLGPQIEFSPVLIIDDEADQAGLNNLVNKDDESSTYREILALRGVLPGHSYLQYTATPQAPLLINVIDVLSPDFAQVLAAGKGYTGGERFFRGEPSLVRRIPDDEVPTKDGTPAKVPKSLQEAMRQYFLGVSAGLSLSATPKGNRSMMVHPAVQKQRHNIYYRWVQNVRDRWKCLLSEREDDPDRKEFIDEFLCSYADLEETVPSLPAFEELLGRLKYAILSTRVLEINTRIGRTPSVPWTDSYSWILVGGTALDRGFTVEGLTVTYMPRGGGVGNADTIQQRARFFGYKESYLGYCRVFLPDGLREQYALYTDHERNVRRQIARHVGSGEPLSTWKRAFLLDSSLKPTRQAVLNLDYFRLASKGKGWHWMKRPHVLDSTREWNIAQVSAFCESHEFLPTAGHPQATEPQKHAETTLTVAKLLDKLLVNLKWGSSSDSVLYTALLVQLEHIAEEHPGSLATVYAMGKRRLRTRSLSGDRIPALLQGRDPKTGYPGDSKVLPSDPKRVAVQIHWLNLVQSEQRKASSQRERPLEAVTFAFHLQEWSGVYVQLGQ